MSEFDFKTLSSYQKLSPSQSAKIAGCRLKRKGLVSVGCKLPTRLALCKCEHKNTSVHPAPLFQKVDFSIQQINHYPWYMYHEPKPFEFLSSSSRNNNDGDDNNNNNNNSFSLRGYLADSLIEETTIIQIKSNHQMLLFAERGIPKYTGKTSDSRVPTNSICTWF